MTLKIQDRPRNTSSEPTPSPARPCRCWLQPTKPTLSYPRAPTEPYRQLPRHALHPRPPCPSPHAPAGAHLATAGSSISCRSCTTLGSAAAAAADSSLLSSSASAERSASCICSAISRRRSRRNSSCTERVVPRCGVRGVRVWRSGGLPNRGTAVWQGDQRSRPNLILRRPGAVAGARVRRGFVFMCSACFRPTARRLGHGVAWSFKAADKW